MEQLKFNTYLKKKKIKWNSSSLERQNYKDLKFGKKRFLAISAAT